MENVIIETVVQIVATLLITLIGVLGTWLTTKIAKREELKNISIATNELMAMAQTTVLELQQTVVSGWKEASADGKLTKEEIKQLGVMLVNGTIEKMSQTSMDLLKAAGVDITAIIHGAGEALITQMKNK